MRIAAFFLLFISMVAVFTPCCEIDGCGEDTTERTMDDRNGADGTCSPFSSCATCLAAVELNGIIQVEESGPLVAVALSTEILISLPSYHSAFWQPPRAV